MTVSRFLAFLGLVFIIALGLYLLTTPKGSEMPLVGVLSGNEVIVSSKIAGRLGRLLVDEGSEVKPGQLIAELDHAEWEAQLASAVANARSLEARIQQVKNTWTWTNEQTDAALNRTAASLTATKAQLDQARAELWRIELEHKRTLELFQGGIVPVQERDRVEAAGFSCACDGLHLGGVGDGCALCWECLGAAAAFLVSPAGVPLAVFVLHVGDLVGDRIVFRRS
jgi:multidrug resistance efflux pump